MLSIKNLYRIGPGPSSSHTIGPKNACLDFLSKNSEATQFEVHLYGSLSLTAIGHGTDHIIKEVFHNKQVNIFHHSGELNDYSNGMQIIAKSGEQVCMQMDYNSVGGGEILIDGETSDVKEIHYPYASITETLKHASTLNKDLYHYILDVEGEEIVLFLSNILDAMFASVERGLSKSGYLPGPLKLKRVAKSLYLQAMNTTSPVERQKLLISSYAYAVSEENADGGIVVTAPTCGASGVLPAVIYYLYHHENISRQRLIEALAIAGLFGNVVKRNASISGAQGGCQAEVGTACSMASAAYSYVESLSNEQIEYAAEIAMEHHLGLTCDPVMGFVQIPCIERNGVAALRVLDAVLYAKHLGKLRSNRVSFDSVVKVMYQTGLDLKKEYRETALGGLAKYFNHETEC